eukprot:26343-Pelagococcus_subviridis.AAC.1
MSPPSTSLLISFPTCAASALGMDAAPSSDGFGFLSLGFAASFSFFNVSPLACASIRFSFLDSFLFSSGGRDSDFSGASSPTAAPFVDSASGLSFFAARRPFSGAGAGAGEPAAAFSPSPADSPPSAGCPFGSGISPFAGRLSSTGTGGGVLAAAASRSRAPGGVYAPTG